MSRRVRAAIGVRGVTLPDGWTLDSGDEVVVSDATWAQILLDAETLGRLVDLGATSDAVSEPPSWRDIQRATTGFVASDPSEVAADLALHVAATTNVHGIADTSNLAPDDIPSLTLIFENGIV